MYQFEGYLQIGIFCKCAFLGQIYRYFLYASVSSYCYVYHQSLNISQIGIFYVHQTDRYFLCASFR